MARRGRSAEEANQFANGDLTTDEFMERAAVLNWTPGGEAWERRGKQTRR